MGPISVCGSRKGNVARIFGTHDWDVDTGKPYGEAGVLIQYNCKRCNAETFSVASAKNSSTSEAMEKRVLYLF